MVLRTSTSHEEGVDRKWSILTKEFISDENGNVKALRIVDIKWDIGYSGKPEFKEIEGTERDLPCDLALLAIGFVHGETENIREKVELELDARGNISTNDYQTNIENVFAAGDMRRGQSLVVWAISEGREAARAVDKYLMKESMLEARDESLMDVNQ
jgi:glutamate synthase (NADPH/NADH) small chain